MFEIIKISLFSSVPTVTPIPQAITENFGSPLTFQLPNNQLDPQLQQYQMQMQQYYMQMQQ